MIYVLRMEAEHEEEKIYELFKKVWFLVWLVWLFKHLLCVCNLYYHYLQDNLQLLALLIGATNSLINPVIYGFWYPDFRRTAIKTMYKM